MYDFFFEIEMICAYERQRTKRDEDRRVEGSRNIATKYCEATRERDIAERNPSERTHGAYGCRGRHALTTKRNGRRKRKKAVREARDVNESPGTSRVSWPKAKL